MGSLLPPARTITFSNVPAAPTPRVWPTGDDVFDYDHDDGDAVNDADTGGDDNDAPEVMTFSAAAKRASMNNTHALQNVASQAARRARRARRASEFSPSTLADREDRTSMASGTVSPAIGSPITNRRRASEHLPASVLSEAYKPEPLRKLTPREARTVTEFVRERTTEKTAGKYTIRSRSGASKKARNQHIGKKAMAFLKKAFSRNHRMEANDAYQRSTRCSNATRTRTL